MRRFFRFLLELLPRLLEVWEGICVAVASPGFHKLGFYLSTFFFGAAGLRLWRRPVVPWWKRISTRALACLFMLLDVWIFLRICYELARRGPVALIVSCGVLALALLVLLLLGRVVGWVFRILGFDESREPPAVPATLTFTLTRFDKVALGFIAVILLVFFVNRDQLMPKEDSDHNYHMAVARMIIEKKCIPVWDDWEYAPAGRPHLYPPVLHLAIAALSGRADKIEDGFETLQVLTYPLALLLTWWFARWWFGDRVGLLTTLIFSMDMVAGFTMLGVLPSALVTAWMPLVFMCFLTRRKHATIVLLTLSLYTHMGISSMILFGLFLFAVRHRGYYLFYKKVLLWSVLLYLPWFLRLLGRLDWLGTPTTAIAEAAGGTLGALVFGALLGFLMLQAINVIFLALGLWGLKRSRQPGASFLRYMLVGFLPLLLSYGGRYWMHTAPVWAVFVACVLLRFLPERATRKRLAVLVLCTLLPLPIVAVGMPSGGRFVRIMPSIGGGAFALGYVFTPAQEDHDFQQLAEFIKTHTTPREIVHIDPNRNYLGDRIVTATGRRVDVGGWGPEVRTRRMIRTVQHYRQIDTNCLFVYERRDVPTELNCDRTERIGRFRIGIRGKTLPLETQIHPRTEREGD